MKVDKEDFSLTTSIPPALNLPPEEEKSQVNIKIEQPEPRTMMFREAGAKFRVKILSDKMVGDLRIVELECVEVVRKSSLFGAIPPGEKFTVSAKKGWEVYAGWVLQEDEIYPEDIPGVAIVRIPPTMRPKSS